MRGQRKALCGVHLNWKENRWVLFSSFPCKVTRLLLFDQPHLLLHILPLQNSKLKVLPLALPPPRAHQSSAADCCSTWTHPFRVVLTFWSGAAAAQVGATACLQTQHVLNAVRHRSWSLLTKKEKAGRRLLRMQGEAVQLARRPCRWNCNLQSYWPRGKKVATPTMSTFCLPAGRSVKGPKSLASRKCHIDAAEKASSRETGGQTPCEGPNYLLRDYAPLTFLRLPAWLKMKRKRTYSRTAVN